MTETRSATLPSGTVCASFTGAFRADLQIEYEMPDQSIARVNLELTTEDYRPRQLADKARAGFTLYSHGDDASHVRRVLSDRELTAEILSYEHSQRQIEPSRRLATPFRRHVSSISWPCIPGTSRPASSWPLSMQARLSDSFAGAEAHHPGTRHDA